ncbi:MAG TPA: CYCXC family (seleno)protein [Candidatus Acidoferrum sp.]|nr:CYCXC family (seleno)protein [Candidatus Acidoferrum sp.]
MGAKSRIICGAILCGAALGMAIAAPRAASHQTQGAEEPVPAFHSEAPQGRLPETLSPAQFTNIAVQNAYILAAQVKKILYQQPCYCHCDRSQGHGSLLDCFASRHGSGCDVCMREAIYSYEQSHKGKTAAQIRAGIERGEWRDVDMSKYAAPVVAK